MAIVIKEVIVKTTVEHKVPQWSAQLPEGAVRKLKQEIISELSDASSMRLMRNDRKKR